MVQGVAAVWLPVDDMERAVGFYRDTLGLRVTRQEDDWSELEANGLRLGLNASEGETPGGEGGAVVSFQPEGSLDEAVEELRAQGVDFAGGISEHPLGAHRRDARPGRQLAAALRAARMSESDEDREVRRRRRTRRRRAGGTHS
jgi:catechol 2,3-dioxygenase-like lactoylglutathione lyase family enzyme